MQSDDVMPAGCPSISEPAPSTGLRSSDELQAVGTTCMLGIHPQTMKPNMCALSVNGES
jgi:hypothetical protein